MNIKNELPPNWDAITETFPAIKDATRTIITYFPNVYVPYTKVEVLPPDLAIHEGIHLKQQEEIGAEAWWSMYLKDQGFRLKQELEAYGAQYAFFRNYQNAIKKHVIFRIASDLSSDMYGNIISYAEAETLIKKYAKALDTNTPEIT